MESSQTNKGRGERIRRLRETRGWSQEQLAKLLGLSPSYISLVERDHSAPARRTLFRMSDVFGVSVHMIERGHEFTYQDGIKTGGSET